jgi:hypothetical protein
MILPLTCLTICWFPTTATARKFIGVDGVKPEEQIKRRSGRAHMATGASSRASLLSSAHHLPLMLQDTGQQHGHQMALYLP